MTAGLDPVGAEPRSRADRWATAAGALAGIAVLVAFTVPRIDRYGLWLDEAFSQGTINQFHLAVRSTGGTMVLYYALLKVWAAIGGESVWWLRSLSLVLSAGTLVVLAGLGRRLGGGRLALVAPATCALCYLFALKSYDARAYALEVLVVTVAWYALVRMVETGPDDRREVRRWTWVLTGALTLGPLAHGLFVVFVGAVCVAAVLTPRPWWTFARVLPGLAGSALAVGALLAAGAGEVGAWVPSTTARALSYGVRHLTSPNRLVAGLLVALFAVGSAAGVLRLTRARSRGSWPGAGVPAGPRPDGAQAWKSTVAPVWVLVPVVELLALSVVRPSFIDRYLTAVSPGLALGIGAGAIVVHDAVADRLGRRPGPVRRRGLVAVPALVALVALALAQSTVVQGDREDWRRAAEAVARLSRPGDAIILSGELTRPPFESAWAHTPHEASPVVVDSHRPLGEVRRVQPWKTVEQTMHDLGRYDRVWLVSRWYSPAAIRLTREPPLTTDYRMTEHLAFKSQYGGTIIVYLYESRPEPST